MAGNKPAATANNKLTSERERVWCSGLLVAAAGGRWNHGAIRFLCAAPAARGRGSGAPGSPTRPGAVLPFSGVRIKLRHPLVPGSGSAGGATLFWCFGRGFSGVWMSSFGQIRRPFPGFTGNPDDYAFRIAVSEPQGTAVWAAAGG